MDSSKVVPSIDLPVLVPFGPAEPIGFLRHDVLVDRARHLLPDTFATDPNVAVEAIRALMADEWQGTAESRIARIRATVDEDRLSLIDLSPDELTDFDREFDADKSDAADKPAVVFPTTVTHRRIETGRGTEVVTFRRNVTVIGHARHAHDARSFCRENVVTLQHQADALLSAVGYLVDDLKADYWADVAEAVAAERVPRSPSSLDLADMPFSNDRHDVQMPVSISIHVAPYRPLQGALSVDRSIVKDSAISSPAVSLVDSAVRNRTGWAGRIANVSGKQDKARQDARRTIVDGQTTQYATLYRGRCIVGIGKGKWITLPNSDDARRARMSATAQRQEDSTTEVRGVEAGEIAHRLLMSGRTTFALKVGDMRITVAPGGRTGSFMVRFAVKGQGRKSTTATDAAYVRSAIERRCMA